VTSVPSPFDAFADRTDYPLVVVTTIAADGERSGCLAGFVTQCSIDPPRLLVCISKVNHTFGVAQRARLFTVHLLGNHQSDLASLFGEQTGDHIDKFSHARWRPGPRGVPLLDDCAAWVVVELVDRFDLGDHQALLTAPQSGGTGTESGLMTVRTAPPFDAGHPAD
jgi:flavin reductase (DIM6/NTAB) family NADH-FMN oxidoreductase RutF